MLLTLTATLLCVTDGRTAAGTTVQTFSTSISVESNKMMLLPSSLQPPVTINTCQVCSQSGVCHFKLTISPLSSLKFEQEWTYRPTLRSGRSRAQPDVEYTETFFSALYPPVMT